MQLTNGTTSAQVNEPDDEKLDRNDENDQESHPKLMKQTILDAFTALTDKLNRKRSQAAVNLVTYAVKGKESEVDYTLKRLIRGIGSSKEYVRQSYYIALHTLLKSSPQLDYRVVFSHMKKVLKTSSSCSKGEKSDIYEGQILVYGAIISSGVFSKMDEPDQNNVLAQLLTIAKKRNHLITLAYLFLYLFLDLIDAKGFARFWTTVFEPEYPKTLADMTIDTLLFQLLAIEKFGGACVTRQFDVNAESIVDIVEKLLNIPRISALKHPVYDRIAKIVSENYALIEPLSICVDDQLKKNPLNRNRRLIAVTFTKKICDNIHKRDSMPNLTDLLSTQLVTRLTQLGKLSEIDPESWHVINEYFASFIKCVQKSDNDKEKVACLTKLFDANMMFEKLTNVRLIQQITVTLSKNGVKKLAKTYASIVRNDGTRKYTNAERTYVAHLMKKLTHLPQMSSEFEWKVKCVKLLVDHALFENTNVDKVLAASLKDCLFGMLDQKFAELQDLRRFLQDIVSYTDSKMREETLRTPFTDESVKTWTSIIKLTEKSGNVFSMLSLHMAMQVFLDPELAASSVNELKSCYKRSKKNTNGNATGVDRSNEEPEWLEVVVDLILELLSRNSHLLRSAIKCVFGFLCDDLSEKILGQVLLVLDPSKKTNPLVDEDNEEVQSDGGDDDGSVDDDASDDDDATDDDDDEDVDDDDEDDAEVQTRNEKLQMDLHQALRNLDETKDDDSNSIDLDDMTEEEGRRLDETLSKVFQEHKPRPKFDLEAQTQIMHFRVRVLDLIEIYIQSSKQPRLLDVMRVLIGLLEFCVKDALQKPLETRVRACLKKMTTKKLDGQMKEKKLVKLLKDLLDRSERSSAVAAQIADKVSECVVWLVKNIHSINPNSSRLHDVVLQALDDFFTKRHTSLTAGLFKQILSSNFAFVWELVDAIFKVIFRDDIRQFRRNQAVELLVFFVRNNVRLIASDAERARDRLREIERGLNVLTKSSCLTDKFQCLLVQLISCLLHLRKQQKWDGSELNACEIVGVFNSSKASKGLKSGLRRVCQQVGVNFVDLPTVKEEVDEVVEGDKNDKEEEIEKLTKKEKKKNIHGELLKLKKKTKVVRAEISGQGLDTNLFEGLARLGDVEMDIDGESDDDDDEDSSETTSNKRKKSSKSGKTKRLKS